MPSLKSSLALGFFSTLLFFKGCSSKAPLLCCPLLKRALLCLEIDDLILLLLDKLLYEALLGILEPNYDLAVTIVSILCDSASSFLNSSYIGDMSLAFLSRLLLLAAIDLLRPRSVDIYVPPCEPSRKDRH